MNKPTQTDESFLRIYQAFSRTVFGIAFNYTKSSADAGDIVQEVFIKWRIWSFSGR